MNWVDGEKKLPRLDSCQVYILLKPCGSAVSVAAKSNYPYGALHPPRTPRTHILLDQRPNLINCCSDFFRTGIHISQRGLVLLTLRSFREHYMVYSHGQLNRFTATTTCESKNSDQQSKSQPCQRCFWPNLSTLAPVAAYASICTDASCAAVCACAYLCTSNVCAYKRALQKCLGASII